MTEDEHHLSPVQEERNRRVDLEIENSRMAMLDAGPSADLAAILRAKLRGAWDLGYEHGKVLVCDHPQKCRDEECEMAIPADAQAALDALLAQAREEGRIAGLREAAEVAHFYAEADYAAMQYPEDGAIAASGTANMIHGDILSLIPAGVEKEPTP